MKSNDELDRMLQHIRLPGVAPGPHQQRLKQALLDQMQASPGENVLGRWQAFATLPLVRVAAVCLVAVVLMGSGWAAENVYEKIAKRYWGNEPIFELQWTSPSGDRTWRTGMIVGGTANDPEAAAAQTRRHLDAIKKLIAEKKYTLLNTFHAPGGEVQYVYQFEPPAGEKFAMNFSQRLEEVTSWEEYVESSKTQIERRHQRIQEAVARGQFRLLDLDVFQIHLCREVDSGQKVDVQRIEMHDGKEIALVSNHPAHEAKGQYETDWKDHLATIRAGERELLDLDIVRNYTYEVTLADGSKTIFNYASDSPLKQPSP